MLSSQREKSHAIEESGFATHSKSSCVPLAYLTAKIAMGKIPSQPSTSTCKREVGVCVRGVRRRRSTAAGNEVQAYDGQH